MTQEQRLQSYIKEYQEKKLFGELTVKFIGGKIVMFKKVITEKE